MNDIINIGGQHHFVLGAVSGTSEQTMLSDLVKDMTVLTHAGNTLSVRLLSDEEYDALLVEDTRTKNGWLARVEETDGYRLVRSTTGRTLREMIPPSALTEAESRWFGEASAEEMSWWKVCGYWMAQDADGVWRVYDTEQRARNFATVDRARSHAQEIALRMFRRLVDSAICELVEL